MLKRIGTGMGVGPEIERKEKRVKVNECSPLKKYYGMLHPSEETLLDYIENKLSDKERVEVEHHIQFCHRCMGALSMAQNLPSEEELKKIKVPKEWIKKAKKISLERRKE